MMPDAFVTQNFTNCMTVRELKEMIKDWPDVNNFGEDCEVWIETGFASSSPVIRAGALNLREDDDGSQSADLLLQSGAFSKANSQHGVAVKPIISHPIFGSAVCPTCGKAAELVQDPFFRWRHCGQSWVAVGSPMDVANELIAASIPDK